MAHLTYLHFFLGFPWFLRALHLFCPVWHMPLPADFSGAVQVVFPCNL